MRNYTYSSSRVAPLRRQRRQESGRDVLDFNPVTLDAVDAIGRWLKMSGSRANDFSVGGVMMWVDYFHYEFCIVNDTLFIKGVSEVHSELPAFSLPVGRMGLAESVGLIVDYCRRRGLTPRLSAVPADRVDDVLAVMPGRKELLPDWSDYIYEAQSLATLAGKKLSKKRNHVNRFEADNPGNTFEPLMPAMLPEVREAYLGWLGSDAGASLEASSAIEESAQTLAVMDHFDRYPFEGAVLRDGTGRIVAFTMGEMIGDTLFTHIEKMDHTVAGAGETVNKLFAVMMTERYPALRYINREEDAGDPGLRQAKLSYHPAIILEKYDIIL